MSIQRYSFVVPDRYDAKLHYGGKLDEGGEYALFEDCMAEIEYLLDTLKPFLDLEDKATYIIGTVTNADIQRAIAVYSKYRGEE